MNWKLLLISSLFLFGCAANRTEPVTDVQTIVKWRTFNCGTPPQIDFVDFNSLTWRVVDGRFTLTADEYAKLGENVSQVIKITKQMLLKIEYYEECIDSAEMSGEE